MFDRFYVKFANGSKGYVTSMADLTSPDVIDVISMERTFDNGKTWKTVDYLSYRYVD